MNGNDKSNIQDETPRNEAKKKSFFHFANRKFQFAAAALVICIATVSALTFIPGINLFGTTYEFCRHQHDESCGWAEAAPCSHQHDGSCGESGANCSHEHDDTCGYAEAAPCLHQHDKSCGGLELDSSAPNAADIDAVVIIMAFDPLEDDILEQSYDSWELASQDDLNLPDTLYATDEEGNPLVIADLAWNCISPLDGFAPTVPSWYDFSPELPEGYALAQSAAAPVISVFIRPEGGGDSETKSNESTRLSNPKQTLDEINEKYNPHKIIFNKQHDKLNALTSHAQGYAKYHGDNYDFHIIPYSNVAGKQGYLYFESDQRNAKGESLYQFTIRCPGVEIRHKSVATGSKAVYNPHFNHPCGLQVFGDYLVVPVIPYHTANGKFYDSCIVYLYDLSSLKGENPQKPSVYKEIMRIPKVRGASMSCAGIIDLPNGDYALGLVADNKLDIYISSNQPDRLWDATWETSPDYKYSLKASAGKNHYQGMGLFLDSNADVYMIGLDTRNGASKDDYADLYRLTIDGGWNDDGQLKPIAEKHLIGGTGARFTYGGGIEVMGNDKLRIYSIESYYTDGGLRINWWD